MKWSERTHCKNDHEFVKDNIVWYRGYRMCRTCRNINAKIFRKRHKEAVNQWHKDNYMKNYGQITEYRRKYRESHRDKTNKYHLKIPYIDMLKNQGGMCEACGDVPQESVLAIDHDHSCCLLNSSCGDCVRGLLCRNCNMALGLVHDSEDRLFKLVAYLRKYKDRHTISTMDDVCIAA